MKRSPTMLALVTDAFGGRGGIAQYNRDFLAALASAGRSKVVVLPRHAPDCRRGHQMELNSALQDSEGLLIHGVQ